MEPFNAQEFIRSLMTQFFTHSCQEQEGITTSLEALMRMQVVHADLVKEFARKIDTQRYLIVLEDMCNMAQWDAIRSYLPDMKKGSRIVVLTHQPVIASLCTGEPCRVSELAQFSPDHSVRIYFKEVKFNNILPPFSFNRIISKSEKFSFDSLIPISIVLMTIGA
jgi:hypothetical protein